MVRMRNVIIATKFTKVAVALSIDAGGTHRANLLRVESIQGQATKFINVDLQGVCEVRHADTTMLSAMSDMHT